jgi:hypothetical protein
MTRGGSGIGITACVLGARSEPAEVLGIERDEVKNDPLAEHSDGLKTTNNNPNGSSLMFGNVRYQTIQNLGGQYGQEFSYPARGCPRTKDLLWRPDL